jgi:hypothetical protein
VSPKKNGEVLLKMKSGHEALIRKKLGKGSAYLLGFCLQDTYFQTYRDSNEIDRKQLSDLLTGIFRDAKVQSHIYSSNPDIEAAVELTKKKAICLSSIMSHLTRKQVFAFRI